MEPNFYPAAVNTTRAHRVPSAADFDDLVQEGVIAAWQATSSTERRDPQVYGNVVASRRIAGFLSGRYPATGSERTDGSRSHDVARHSTRLAPLEAVADRENDGPDLTTREAVHAAVRALPRDEDRRAVWLVFWQGYTRAEAAVELGISTAALNRRWADRIAPALRVLLEDGR